MIEKIVLVWIVVMLTLWFVAQFIERWQAARRQTEEIDNLLRETTIIYAAPRPVAIHDNWRDFCANETDAMYRAYVREHEAQELQDALRLPELDADDAEFLGMN